MALQFRRGTAAQRAASSEIPAEGEPWFTYDDGQLYVGDGVTGGGVKVGSNLNINDLTGVQLISEETNTVTSYAVTSNVVTVTTATDHGYYESLEVTISDSSVSALNGTHLIVLATSLNSFAFELVLADTASTAATGDITPKVRDGAALVWDEANSRWNDGTPQVALYDLSNTNLLTTPPTDGQALVYDSATNKWGAGFPAMDIGDLGDVDTATAPTDGQYITWDNATSNWKPSTLSLDLGEIADVDLSTPAADGEILVYDNTSSTWLPSSNNLADIQDVDLSTAAADGEVLVYSNASSTWVPGTPATQLQHTQFYYTLAAAPTSTIASSAAVGQNLGTWTEITFANAIPGYATPSSAAGDPTLTGVTFNPVTGVFAGFPAGRYIVSYDVEIAIDNITPSFYTAPPALFVVGFAYSIAGDSYYDFANLPILPYSSYGSAQALVRKSATINAVLSDTTPANNGFMIVLDQDQGTSHYAQGASVNFTRIGDV